MSFGAGAFKVEAVDVSIQDRGFSGFANNMIKIPVKKTKKTGLLARTRAFIL